MSLRSLIAVSVTALFGVFLVACQKVVSRSDLPGAWVPQKSSRKWLKTTNSCQIVFQADGTFIASVPDYMMGTYDQDSGLTLSGKGQWVIESDGVKLHFDEVNGKHVNWEAEPLQTQEDKDKVELFFYVKEEGGDRFVFERMPAQVAPQDAGK
jgi:hypothetical protein